ncbi:MAG TPA: adenylyltransferase/cytidyltransferase family protein, partial [Vicinamibacterales bacterium]|nr:adenylyltransferase/cytidyltransferase family protein [Vicinamibacterales bacterium]
MHAIHFPDDPPPRWNQPVLALGNFDGLHRGHGKIIDRVRRRAGERGGTPAAMTFDPHPPRVVRPDKAPPLLMTKAQRLESLARAGMQGVAVVRFTPELSQWDPETFVRTVLVEWLHVVEVWVGANFLFGHDPDLDHVQPFDEHRAHERLRIPLRQFRCEADYRDALHAGARERLEPLRLRHQERRRLVGTDDAGWVRIERHGRRRPAAFPGAP